LIIGKSGTGKSTFAYQQLRKFEKNGQFTLRIIPQFIENSISIRNAFTKQLKEYQEKLKIEDSFFTQLRNSPIIGVFDDVNNTSNPLKLIEKILIWENNPSFIVLVPIWVNVYNQLPSRLREEKEKLINKIYIDKYSIYESFNAINKVSQKRNLGCSRYQTETIAFELFYSPFLLGTCGSLNQLNSDNWLQCTVNPIEEYINEKINEIERVTSLNTYEIIETLNILSEKILITKKLHFSFTKTKNVFTNHDLQIIKCNR